MTEKTIIGLRKELREHTSISMKRNIEGIVDISAGFAIGGKIWIQAVAHQVEEDEPILMSRGRNKNT